MIKAIDIGHIQDGVRKHNEKVAEGARIRADIMNDLKHTAWAVSHQNNKFNYYIVVNLLLTWVSPALSKNGQGMYVYSSCSIISKSSDLNILKIFKYKGSRADRYRI